MNEGGELRAALAAGRLDRAPAQIVAEIAPGVARYPRVDAGGAGRAQQFGGMRAERQGVGAAGDRSLARAAAIGIGERGGDGVARPGFDPDISGAPGEAETQQRLRTILY